MRTESTSCTVSYCAESIIKICGEAPCSLILRRVKFRTGSYCAESNSNQDHTARSQSVSRRDLLKFYCTVLSIRSSNPVKVAGRILILKMNIKWREGGGERECALYFCTSSPESVKNSFQ